MQKFLRYWREIFFMGLLFGVGAQAAFAQSVTHFDEYYYDSQATNLRADIITYDLIPPSEPTLIEPKNDEHLCTGQPIFVWQEATDNKSIAHYTFWLEYTPLNGLRQTIEKVFSGPLDNDEYEVWKEDGQYYLRFKNIFTYGHFYWRVTATDPSKNYATSETWHWDYLPTFCPVDCETKEVLPAASLIAPARQISDRLPAISFTFDPEDPPEAFSVLIDGVTVFANLPLLTRNTTRYNLSVFEDGQAVFQPLFNYLPYKTGETVNYLLTVRLLDSDSCQRDLKLTVALDNDEEIEDKALVPQLLTPANESVWNNKPKTFSWDVCVDGGTLASQTFILNGKSLESRGTGYTLTLESRDETACGTTWRYTLTLTGDSDNSMSAQQNDPNDATDWNRWQVTVLSESGLRANSSVYRFRVLPARLAIYSWCSDQNTCTSGTLVECQAAGRNCYYRDEASCRQNAANDCGPNPPQRTYHWCAGATVCTRGSLAECLQTGKNCYLQENNLDGNGCLQHATAECSNEARYTWCSTSLTCEHGSFAECVASGQPCYLENDTNRNCPAEILRDCGTGVTASSPFSD